MRPTDDYLRLLADIDYAKTVLLGVALVGLVVLLLLALHFSERR